MKILSTDLAAPAQGRCCAGVVQVLCRFPDACMTTPSARADSRRPESAKARNRGGGLRSSPRAPERVSDGEIEVHAMRAWHGS